MERTKMERTKVMERTKKNMESNSISIWLSVFILKYSYEIKCNLNCVMIKTKYFQIW